MLLCDGEVILKKGAATQVVSYEGIGGKLLLTSKRLVFTSHPFNFQNREDSIDIKQITNIVVKKSDYISRKITIHLTDNSVKEFIVYKRKAWVRQICDAARAMNREVKVYSTSDQGPLGGVSGEERPFLSGMLARAIFIGFFVAILMFLLLR